MDAICTTTSEVIDALGGTAKVARLMKRRPQAVSNWRDRPAFPPETFLAFRTALETIGHAAPPKLWRMEISPPPSPSSSEERVA